MKNSFALYFILVAIAAVFGCMKTVSSNSGVKMDATIQNALQNKWTYTSWSSCPQNVLSGAPCFQYQQANTDLYGTGTVSLTIGTDNKISWVKEGTFKQLPFSYLFPAANDTLGYQPVNDSTFVLIDKNNTVIDSVKIKALTEHFLVLNYLVPQYGNPFQLDSLKR